MATAVSIGGGLTARLDDAKEGILNPTPLELAGALKPTTALAAGQSAKERIWVGGAKELHVLAKVSGVTSTPTVAIYGLEAAATDNDTDGAERHGIGDPTPVDLSNGWNQVSRDSFGEQYVEVEVACGAGEAVTIDKVQIFWR